MLKNNQWILGRPSFDFLGLVLPGYLGLILVWLFADTAPAVMIIGFFGLVLVDSGHVYTTFFRGPFFEVNNLSKTLGSLLGIFLFLFLWLYFQVPYFWPFITYFTLFHHVRQYVGLIKWYNKIDDYFDPLLIQFFYASVFVSIFLFHVNPEVTSFYYAIQGDVFYFPSFGAYNFVLNVQFGIYFLYTIYAAYIFLIKKEKPFKTHLFFISAIVFYFLVCSMNRASELVFLPLLFAHGIPYFLLILKSKGRLEPSLSKYKILFIVFGFAFLFAIIEYLLQENVVVFEYLKNPSVFQKVILAIFLTPLIFHYLIDGYIWKSKHFLARKIYLSQTP
jgi:hypothetical protein